MVLHSDGVNWRSRSSEVESSLTQDAMQPALVAWWLITFFM
jgi:hypothetical protein